MASLRKVDLALELQILSFYRQRGDNGDGPPTPRSFDASEPVG